MDWHRIKGWMAMSEALDSFEEADLKLKEAQARAQAEWNPWIQERKN